MNAGTPPEPGASRIELRTYRVDRDGRRVGPDRVRVHAGAAPAAVPKTLWWPPCRCPRCREREVIAGARNDPSTTSETQGRTEQLPRTNSPTEEDRRRTGM
ncbi:hypothetical protein [Streptomyces colonosanans]|uniref:Uncharacterized protein n=1 Tax=Streptomyces colonosanans TaxID=1428652 RepID=A0A1S2NVZ3_9ACTN|nr:hypothetical protein [Streptomyces colonosanans]OIJ85422.1 hypothetical protein BIV24_28540 [Streptomyces colonosanans]